MTATASVQENKSKHTRGYKNERFLISTRQNKVQIFGIHCLRQTNIKQEMVKTLSSMSLLKIVGELHWKAPSLAKIEFGNSKLDLSEGGCFSPTTINSDIKLVFSPVRVLYLSVRLSFYAQSTAKGHIKAKRARETSHTRLHEQWLTHTHII